MARLHLGIPSCASYCTRYCHLNVAEISFSLLVLIEYLIYVHRLSSINLSKNFSIHSLTLSSAHFVLQLSASNQISRQPLERAHSCTIKNYVDSSRLSNFAKFSSFTLLRRRSDTESLAGCFRLLFVVIIRVTR
jgi:hypothetical protein